MDLPTTVKAVGVAVYDIIAAALGADTVSFAGAGVALVDEDFTPEIGMAVPSFMSTNGVAPIVASGNVVLVSTDPATGDRLFKIKPPAGGWYWVTTSAPDPAVTIFGWVTYRDEDGVIAAGKFETPVVLDATGQSIGVDSVEFRLPSGGLT